MSDARYLHMIRPDCPLPSGASVVLYARDSGGEEQDTSLDQQIAAMHEYCARHGLVIERTYRDVGTGSSTERRAQYNAMLDDLRGRFKLVRDVNKRSAAAAKAPFGVIVWKQERLGRDYDERTAVTTELRMRAITLVSLTRAVSTGNPLMDALAEQIYAILDQQLLTEISQNAKRGLARLVSMRDTDPEFLTHNPDWQSTGAYLGIMPGVPPAGFRAERIRIGTYQRKGGQRLGEAREVQRIVPDKDSGMWARARLAWEMRAQGAQIAAIHRATSLFRNINSYTTFFRNRIYTGDFMYGGHLHEGFVEAMIPREWYEREQALQVERGKAQRSGSVGSPENARRKGAGYLLSGLIWCAHVEGEIHPMHGHNIPAKGNKKRWDFYLCNVKKATKGRACQASRIGANKLHALIIDHLMTNVLTVAFIRPLSQAVIAQAQGDQEQQRGLLKAYQSDEVRLTTEITNLTNAIASGASPDVLVKAIAEREQQRNEVRQHIERIRASLSRRDAILQVDDAELEDWLVSIRVALEMGGDMARDALRAFISKIIIKGDDVTVYYRLGAIDEALRSDGLADGAMRLEELAPIPSPPHTILHITSRTRKY